MNVALRLSRTLTHSAVGIRVRKNVKSAFSSKYLLLTNTTLSTLSSLGGDCLAQNFEILNSEGKSFNHSRNLKNGITGVILGPMFHYWYLFLDRTLPGKTAKIIFTKVFLDMTIAPPVSIFFYIGSLGAMDGEKWTKIRGDMIEKGKDLWLAEWMVWPPASAIGFYVLPTKYRVLFESSLSVLMDGYYSFVRFREKSAKRKKLTVVENKILNARSNLLDEFRTLNEEFYDDLIPEGSLCGYSQFEDETFKSEYPIER